MLLPRGVRGYRGDASKIFCSVSGGGSYDSSGCGCMWVMMGDVVVGGVCIGVVMVVC